MITARTKWKVGVAKSVVGMALCPPSLETGIKDKDSGEPGVDHQFNKASQQDARKLAPLLAALASNYSFDIRSESVKYTS